MADPTRLSEELVGFVAQLREAGLSIGVEQGLTFARSVARVGVGMLDLYWAGRASLITGPDAIAIYNRVFADYFLEHLRLGSPSGAQAHASIGSPTSMVTADRDLVEGDGSEQQGAAASYEQVLRRKWFAECSEEELAELHRLMQGFTITVPPRPTRRLRGASHGRRPHLRSTLRRAMRTDGEPVTWTWKQRRVRHRRLVLLLDVSGSMAEYSRALLGFAFAAARSGIPAEAFSFGTRVTRLTPHLQRRGPDEALAAVADQVSDWDGGTRIGASLHDFRLRWGASLARGAIVVICSDGLERGDPEPLRQEMARLQRLAHRVVWVNPLKGDADYAPTARGMASALPSIDVFVPGHNLASLEDLIELLPVLR